MNTLTILFVLPLLIIFSYLFDAFARRTKFPSVILLMFTGILFRVGANAYGFDNFAFLDNLIPVLGTIGLILIVLEGALELEVGKEKRAVIVKGFLAAFLILIFNIFVITWLLQQLSDMTASVAVIYAIPLSIISSAVAIPSAASLLKQDREFVVYESTFSDILGIMIFNYAIGQVGANQPLVAVGSIVALGLQIVGVIIVSLLITYLLFRLLQKIEHHVKFFLILALLILVYALGKLFHLPALVTIFIFGIFLSNVKGLLPSFLRKNLNLEQTESSLHEFHILTAESTFIVRTFFFLFFGFSISLQEFTTTAPFVYGILIIALMFAIRYGYMTLGSLQFKNPFVKIRPSTLVYMSPRGLISILLFLQIGELPFITEADSIIDERVLLVVILGSMLIMIMGTLRRPKEGITTEVGNTERAIAEDMQEEVEKEITIVMDPEITADDRETNSENA